MSGRFGSAPDQNPQGQKSPVAIGGVGGSGTRVVASIMSALGYFMGGDTNESEDNLWYTLLFKRREVLELSSEELAGFVRIFSAAMRGREVVDTDARQAIQSLVTHDRPLHPADFLAERARSLNDALTLRQLHEDWGWKEPNTHVIIPQLASHLPGLRYVHVIRNGLDMAFSDNKNQLHYWADSLFGLNDVDVDQPGTALRYWRLCNERIERMRLTANFPILEVGFENLCREPVEQIQVIANFCGIQLTKQQAVSLASEFVRLPDSTERHLEMDLSELDSDDQDYARSTAARLTSDLHVRHREIFSGSV